MLGASEADVGVRWSCENPFSSLPLLVAVVLGVFAPSPRSESAVMTDNAEASLGCRPCPSGDLKGVHLPGELCLDAALDPPIDAAESRRGRTSLSVLSARMRDPSCLARPRSA